MPVAIPHGGLGTSIREIVREKSREVSIPHGGLRTNSAEDYYVSRG